MYNEKRLQKAVEDYRNGKIIIITDDENRENEGDFCCAAEFSTPEKVNFIITHGRGLLCQAIDSTTAKRIGLKSNAQNDQNGRITNFTDPIDAKKELTTGISAYERDITVHEVLREDSDTSDFVRPGHLFPLIAQDSGVLSRAGHTEAVVDLAKICGLKPSGLLCEILNEDGSMARFGDLEKIAAKHKLAILTVKDIIGYRQSIENWIEFVTESKIPTEKGEFKISAFRDKITREEIVVMHIGNISEGKPLVRVHSECLTGDVFGSQRCDCSAQLNLSLEMIKKEGAGAVIYLPQEGRGIGIVEKIRAYALQDKGEDTYEANLKLGHPEDARSYHQAGWILKKMNVLSIRLITNNPEKIAQLVNIGINVNERIAAATPSTPYNIEYLRTKKMKRGHMM